MKRILKNILTLILCAVIALSLFGCEYVRETFGNLLNTKETAEMEAYPAQTDVPKNYIYSEDEIIQKISELVTKQEKAIIEADKELMAETINPADSWLTMESKHLVADQKVFPAQNYQRSVSEVRKMGEFYIGTVEQNFTFQGLPKESSEQRYFMFDGQNAYDMGTVLEKAMWGRVFAAFPEGYYDFAESLGISINSFVDKLSERWKMNFDEPISLKIYADKYVFLYSIKLSMPDWAGGWYERGESIKTYIYDTSQERYEYMVRHESTHMMLAAATNDNAAYWMQEGFATIMPDYIAKGKLAINRSDVLKEAISQDSLPTVKEHTATNIETLTDMFEVRLYYGFSSAMVLYLLEKTDTATLLKLFNELETYPYISLTMGEKVFDTQAITEKCFKKATGKAFDDFYSGFDDWLKEKLS